MLALRLGSYSIASTLAGTPSLSRRKSILRYCFLCPPPRCQMEISPWLLRPPERFFGSRRLFSGVCLVIWLLSRTVINRRDAVYGLKLFSPISASCPAHLAAACTCRPLLPSPKTQIPSDLQILRDYRFSANSIIFSPSASFTYAFFQSGR